MKKNIQIYVWLLVLVTTAYACSPKGAKDHAATEEDRVVVKTQKVLSQTITQPIISSGILASKKEVKLSFKTGGIIEAIKVEEGQSVTKGQWLASLDLTEISSQVKAATQTYEKAERDLNRAKNLYADSAATMEQVQNAATGLEVARATLQSARFNQQYSTIYAPGNGQILKKFAEAGELIAPGNPVFIFAASGKEQWIIRTGVADRSMVRLANGDGAKVQFDAYPGIGFTATVAEIAQVADPTKGTFEVELRVDPQGKKLVSGMVAKLEITPSQTFSAITIPIEALIEADGEHGYVYTLNEDQQTVKKVPVKITGIYNDLVGISEGLSANATVITEGNSYLTQHSKVKVISQKSVATNQ